MTDRNTCASSLARIRATLHRFGKFRKRWAIIDGVSRFLILALGALLAWFLADWIIGLPLWPLFLLFVGCCALGVWAAARHLPRPLLQRVHVEREALMIERLHGNLDNSLIGSVQLGGAIDQAGGAPASYSAELMSALVVQTGDALEKVRPMSLVDLSRPRRRLLSAAAIVIVSLVCTVVAGEAVRARGDRLLDAWAMVLDSFFPVHMTVMPGDLAVVRGSALTLSVEAAGARRRGITLCITHTQAEVTSREQLRLVNRRASRTGILADSSFTYNFDYGGRVSGTYQITVEDLPDVKTVNYEITPPAYTGQPMQTYTGRVVRLQELGGTMVVVNFAASTELDPEGCHYEWQSEAGRHREIDVSGRFGSFSFTIDRSDRVSIYLTGYLGKGFEMAEPLSFEIGVRPDRVPTVQVLVKEKDAKMTAVMTGRLIVPWLARDDYGVQEVSVKFEVEPISELLNRPKREGKFSQRIEPPRDRAQGQFQSLFNGIEPPLEPGDQVRLKVSATDTNTETGPGVGFSDEISVLVIGDRIGSEFGMQEFGWRQMSERELALGFSERVKRTTDLGRSPTTTISTEKPQAAVKEAVRAIPSQKKMLGDVEDEMGWYFELLTQSSVDGSGTPPPVQPAEEPGNQP